MSRSLLFRVFVLFILQASIFAVSSQSIQVNGLIFHTDLEKPSLCPGESAVFPHSDEATLLLKMASEIKEKRGQEFSLVNDSFCGDGKSGLPIVFHHIATKLIGSDINPRAVQYAKENAALNHLEAKCSFAERNILHDEILCSDAPGNTLWIANPPFALKVKGASVDLMRDGGENGLLLTMAFVKKAIASSTAGDVILGVGYSRIRADGSIELEEELTKATQEKRATFKVTLLEGQKLWRGFNGKKQQENPMPITKETFAQKANPSNPEEVHAYQTAAEFHRHAGFTQLGYFVYVISP